MQGGSHKNVSIVRGAECLLRPPSDCDNSNREELGDDHSVSAEATPPPLGVKLTGYKLFFMAIVFCIGTVKAILTFKGQSTSPTVLEWIGGTFLTILCVNLVYSLHLARGIY